MTPLAANGTRVKAIHDLAELDWAVKTHEIAFAQLRSRDARRELVVGLLVIVCGAVVGSTAFASLGSNPAGWAKVLVGSLGVLTVILTAVNKWTPFADASKRDRVAQKAMALLRVDIESAIRKVDGGKMLPDAVDALIAEKQKTYKEVVDSEETPPVSSKLYDEANPTAKKELEEQLQITL